MPTAPRRALALLVLALVAGVTSVEVAPAPVGAAVSTLSPVVVGLPLDDVRDIAVEPVSGRVVVGGEDGVAVRLADGSAAGVVPGLPGTEALAAGGGAVYALRPAARTVHRIDPVGLAVTATWSLAPRTDPSGLAHAAGRLWTTARNGVGAVVLVSVDPSTGGVATAGGGHPSDLLDVMATSPAAPGLIVGGEAHAGGGDVTVIDVSGDVPAVRVSLPSDGIVADVALTPDGTRVVVGAGAESVEERALPSLDTTGTRYPTAWHETAVATTAVGGPGSLVAVADLGLPGERDLWIHADGDPAALRQATVHTEAREVAAGGMAFSADSSRLYVARQAQVPTPGVSAELLVFDVGPAVTTVAPRVVGTSGGGEVTLQGHGLAGATVRVGGKATTGGSGSGTSRRVAVASLPAGFAPVEASNALGITSTSPTPVVARELGPFADSTEYADRLHRDVLGRGATSAEVLLADAVLAGGASLGAVPVALVRAAPATATRAPIIRLYQAVFLRPPDTAGLAYWLGEQQRGRSLTQIATAMAASPEFRTRYGTLGDAAFVDRIYLNVLGRTADAAGRSYWLGVLATGQPRGKVVLSFAQSPEYVARLTAQVEVTVLHLDLLRRAPTKAQLTAALAAAASTSMDVVAAGIVTSAEYRGRVG